MLIDMTEKAHGNRLRYYAAKVTSTTRVCRHRFTISLFAPRPNSFFSFFRVAKSSERRGRTGPRGPSSRRSNLYRGFEKLKTATLDRGIEFRCERRNSTRHNNGAPNRWGRSHRGCHAIHIPTLNITYPAYIGLDELGISLDYMRRYMYIWGIPCYISTLETATLFSKNFQINLENSALPGVT